MGISPSWPTKSRLVSTVVLQIAALVVVRATLVPLLTRWIGRFLFFMAVNVSGAIESVHLYEQTVGQMPADDDAEW